MNKLKEILLPVLIWVFLIFAAIRGGVNIGNTNFQPSDPMPIKIQIVVVGMSFVMGLIVTIMNMRRGRHFVSQIMERVFSRESFRVIEKRTNPIILGASFFGIIGITGCLIAGFHKMPKINIQISQIPLTLGLGIIVGFLIGKRTVSDFEAGPEKTK